MASRTRCKSPAGHDVVTLILKTHRRSTKSPQVRRALNVTRQTAERESQQPAPGMRDSQVLSPAGLTTATLWTAAHQASRHLTRSPSCEPPAAARPAWARTGRAGRVRTHLDARRGPQEVLHLPQDLLLQQVPGYSLIQVQHKRQSKPNTHTVKSPEIATMPLTL